MLSKYSKRRQIFIISLILFIVIDLLFLIIITLPTTRGFYESSGSSNVEVKIAGWNFLVNGKKEIEKVEIDLSKTLNEGYEKIIPGSSGVINLNIDTTGTDVTMKCKIEMVEEETNKPKNIKLYKDPSYQEEIEDGYEFIIKYDEDKTEKKIYWKWEYTEEDEKEWMEKEIKIKLNVIGEQIIDEEDSILYKKGTLAYEIIKNAMDASKDTERTIYSPEPLTTPAQEVSGPNERTLSVTEDDYGESYYYRGNVQDNYLNFNNMCWRIVRIEGDGSIKLILEDKEITCEEATGGENASIGQATYGFKVEKVDEKTYYQADYQNCTSDTETCIKNKLTIWFNEKFKEENVINKIKDDIWYLGSQKNYYDSNGIDTNKFTTAIESVVSLEGKIYNKKIGNADLKFIDNDNVQSNIGILSVNEYAFAGLIFGQPNSSNYISNKFSGWYWTSTYGGVNFYGNTYRDMIFSIFNNASSMPNELHLAETQYGSNYDSKYIGYVRPCITLNSNIAITGNGLKTSPYKV